MKKYLLAAVMAVAVTGAFVSCSDDVVSGSLIEQKAKAFENAYIEAYGTPAPNHTWGFKTNNIAEAEARGVTRTEVDPKGNMWPEKPTVGTKEEIDVVAYVNRETSDDWTWYYPMPENLNNYFVTQIHKGTDEYHGVNQTQTFVGSNQMDKLMIADVTGSSVDADGALTGSWFHVYDFNGGNSIDYGGNMLVIKSNTYDFSYHGSKDSKYHPRWIAIDGKDVPRTDGVADNYDGYYYICFDYESKPNDVYTVFEMPEHNNAKAYVPGVWEAGTTGEDLLAAGITTVSNGEWGVRTYNVQPGWRAGQVFNGDKWIPGNDIYTDWIIRLVKADVDIPDDPTDEEEWEIIEGEEVVEAGRVFCEDLGASKLNDIDYNDIVFDAIIVHHYIKLVTTKKATDGTITTETKYEFTKNGVSGLSEYYAKICLLAAGGTVPASVAGYEVHDVLSNSSLGTNVMINTTRNKDDVNGAQIDECDPVIIQEAVEGQEETVDKKFMGIKLIKDIEIAVQYGNAVTMLTAETGSTVPAAPYKFCVPIGTPWAKERVSIGEAYRAFPEYNQTGSGQFWEGKGVVATNLWDNCNTLFITEDGTYYYDGMELSKKILASGASASSSTLWSANSSMAYQQLVTAKELLDAGMVKTKAATLKVTGSPVSWGWGNINILKPDYSGFISAGSSNHPEYGHFTDGTGYVSIPISKTELNTLLDAGGMRIGIDNFTFTKVEIIQE